MMTFYIIFGLVIVSVLMIVLLLCNDTSDYFAAYKQSSVLNPVTDDPNKIDKLEEDIVNYMPQINNLIGKAIVLKFIIPSSILFLLCCLIVGPYLTNAKFGMILGIVIALAYSMRLFYHYAYRFRKKLLMQLERILLAIRNNLSTGMTLDHAVTAALKTNGDEPLGPNLARFIKVTETNFLESFPSWLRSIEQSYGLRELGRAAQLLRLELAHTNNQEGAFVNAASRVSDHIMVNRKQRHTVFISFLTMDFMVMALLAVLFHVVPTITLGPDLNWWDAPHRPLVVFVTAMTTWLIYVLTIMITMWRQS